MSKYWNCPATGALIWGVPFLPNVRRTWCAGEYCDSQKFPPWIFNQYAYVTKIRQMKLKTLWKKRNLSKLDDDETGASSSVTVVNQPLPPMRPFQLTLPRILLWKRISLLFGGHTIWANLFYYSPWGFEEIYRVSKFAILFVLITEDLSRSEVLISWDFH